MSARTFAIGELANRLALGWSKDHAEVPRDFMAKAASRWQGCQQPDSERSDASMFQCVLTITQLLYQGACDFGCLIIGHGPTVEDHVKKFWQERGGGGRLSLIIVTSLALEEIVRSRLPASKCAIITAERLVESLLRHPGIDSLRHVILEQVDLRRLLPYDIMHPVAPNMFVGRRDLMNKLNHQETISYAIAGPARIGKSSVLEKYHHEVRCNPRDHRRERIHHIDCLPLAGLDSTSIACELALRLAATSEAQRVNRHTLCRFLGRLSHEGEQPLELLLDEVDGISIDPVCDELAEAVRHGYCRVLLCGKGGLYRMMRRQASQFSRRLTLIMPEPLDHESARRLLLAPLRQLGFTLVGEEAIISAVFELSDRRPQLVQHCAQILIEGALATSTTSIRPEQLRRLHEEFSRTAHATLPLEDLADDLSRLIVLAWLSRKEPVGELSLGHVQKIAADCGLTISAEQAVGVCEDLWICNVLVWENLRYRLAYPKIIEWARRQDFSIEIARLLPLARAVVAGHPLSSRDTTPPCTVY